MKKEEIEKAAEEAVKRLRLSKLTFSRIEQKGDEHSWCIHLRAGRQKVEMDFTLYGPLERAADGIYRQLRFVFPNQHAVDMLDQIAETEARLKGIGGPFRDVLEQVQKTETGTRQLIDFAESVSHRTVVSAFPSDLLEHVRKAESIAREIAGLSDLAHQKLVPISGRDYELMMDAYKGVRESPVVSMHEFVATVNQFHRLVNDIQNPLLKGFTSDWEEVLRSVADVVEFKRTFPGELMELFWAVENASTEKDKRARLKRIQEFLERTVSRIPSDLPKKVLKKVLANLLAELILVNFPILDHHVLAPTQPKPASQDAQVQNADQTGCPREMLMATRRVNVRENASVRGRIIRTLPPNALVFGVDEREGWRRVEYFDFSANPPLIKTGWVYGRFLTPVADLREE